MTINIERATSRHIAIARIMRTIWAEESVVIQRQFSRQSRQPITLRILRQKTTGLSVLSMGFDLFGRKHDALGNRSRRSFAGSTRTTNRLTVDCSINGSRQAKGADQIPGTHSSAMKPANTLCEHWVSYVDRTTSACCRRRNGATNHSCRGRFVLRTGDNMSLPGHLAGTTV